MIYIVEDDSSIRELEQYALQSNGYETTGCEDAASFWAALRSGRPDLVILDVMLPDEDGYQILAKLRADPARAATPVIMVTAKTSEIDVVKGLDHGADDYLCSSAYSLKVSSTGTPPTRTVRDTSSSTMSPKRSVDAAGAGTAAAARRSTARTREMNSMMPNGLEM